MTWEEVCDDPALQDLPFKIELNLRGQIVMSPAKARHGRFQGKITNLLGAMKPDGYAMTEIPIRTAENVKVPDVAWVSFARFGSATDPDDIYTDTAPEICVRCSHPMTFWKNTDSGVGSICNRARRNSGFATNSATCASSTRAARWNAPGSARSFRSRSNSDVRLHAAHASSHAVGR